MAEGNAAAHAASALLFCRDDRQSPLDLAVSKIARYADHDQADIASLAAHGLIDADEVKQRANEAAINYIGNLRSLETSIKLACVLVREHQPKTTTRKNKT